MSSYMFNTNHDQIIDYVNSQPILPFIIGQDNIKSPKDFVLLGNVFVSKDIIKIDYRILYMLDVLFFLIQTVEMSKNIDETSNNLFALTGFTDISYFRLSSIQNERRCIIVYNNGTINIAYDN